MNLGKRITLRRSKISRKIPKLAIRFRTNLTLALPKKERAALLNSLLKES
jgi:hypothetical protein